SPKLRRLTAARHILLLLAVLFACVVASGAAAARTHTHQTRVKIVTIHYRAHDGVSRKAFVVLPAWYGPRNDPPIPLIISPHGRGLTGRANARLWGSLPADGWFAVVNPDGLSPYSWGASAQIEDLARMPKILRRTLPWLHVDAQ